MTDPVSECGTHRVVESSCFQQAPNFLNAALSTDIVTITFSHRTVHDDCTIACGCNPSTPPQSSRIGLRCYGRSPDHELAQSVQLSYSELLLDCVPRQTLDNEMSQKFAPKLCSSRETPMLLSCLENAPPRTAPTRATVHEHECNCTVTQQKTVYPWQAEKPSVDSRH